MAFLKALTVFIVCISIFKIVVPQYRTCGIKGKPECNALLNGTFKCPSCSNYYGHGIVTIYLEEKHMAEHIPIICNGDFYIQRYLEEPHPEVYKAGFYYYCSSPYLTKSVRNRNPLYLKKINGTHAYDFRIIDFTNP